MNSKDYPSSIILKEEVNRREIKATEVASDCDSNLRIKHSPKYLKELLSYNDYYNELSTRFIFFHNKQGAVKGLLDKITTTIKPNYKFEFIDLHRITLAKLKDKVSSAKNEDRVVFIIKNTCNKKNIHNLCTYIFNKKLNCGIWLFDHISNYLPSTLTLFDDLFIFDISISEYESLKSSFYLPRRILAILYNKNETTIGNNRVLFITNSEVSNLYFSEFAMIVDI